MRSLNLSILLTLSTVIWPRFSGCLVNGQHMESASMACTAPEFEPNGQRVMMDISQQAYMAAIPPWGAPQGACMCQVRSHQARQEAQGAVLCMRALSSTACG